METWTGIEGPDEDVLEGAEGPEAPTWGGGKEALQNRQAVRQRTKDRHADRK